MLDTIFSRTQLLPNNPADCGDVHLHHPESERQADLEAIGSVKEHHLNFEDNLQKMKCELTTTGI